MNKLISFFTLKTVSVSIRRKRIFFTTLLLLLLLVASRILSIPSFSTVPYAAKILAVSILVLCVNIIASSLRLFFVSSHRKRRGITSDEKDNFTVGANALVNAATVISIIVFVFLVFDIEFRTFLNSIALFAVALTLIFQDYIKNFLHGLSMMFSADYEIGDYIKVAEMPPGVILTITFSSIHLKTEDGNTLFIPNALIKTHEVLNYSKRKQKRINIDCTVLREQLSQVADFENKILDHLALSFPGVIESDKMQIHIRETTKDDVVFLIEITTKKASLLLREQINDTVQKFAIEYTPLKKVL